MFGFNSYDADDADYRPRLDHDDPRPVAVVVLYTPTVDELALAQLADDGCPLASLED